MWFAVEPFYPNRDGATIGSFARDMPLLAIVRTNAAAVSDPRKFTWLGSSSGFSRDAYTIRISKTLIYCFSKGGRRGAWPR